MEVKMDLLLECQQKNLTVGPSIFFVNGKKNT